jgi:hypothetical protein
MGHMAPVYGYGTPESTLTTVGGRKLILEDSDPQDLSSIKALYTSSLKPHTQ